MCYVVKAVCHRTKGLSICEVQIGVSIGAVFPFLTRLTLGGAVQFSDKIKFMFFLNVDLIKPSGNALAAELKTTLTLQDLIDGIRTMFSKAQKTRAPAKRPTAPLVALKHLKISVSQSDMVCICAIHISAPVHLCPIDISAPVHLCNRTHVQTQFCIFVACTCPPRR